jgi:hypothetical protein
MAARGGGSSVNSELSEIVSGDGSQWNREGGWRLGLPVTRTSHDDILGAFSSLGAGRS